jgi:hypothetical protein
MFFVFAAFGTLAGMGVYLMLGGEHYLIALATNFICALAGVFIADRITP